MVQFEGLEQNCCVPPGVSAGGVSEAAKAVDVPSVSVVVATAIKTKIDIFLAVVLMLTPSTDIRYTRLV
jgi:hypothetical protein